VRDCNRRLSNALKPPSSVAVYLQPGPIRTCPLVCVCLRTKATQMHGLGSLFSLHSLHERTTRASLSMSLAETTQTAVRDSATHRASTLHPNSASIRKDVLGLQSNARRTDLLPQLVVYGRDRTGSYWGEVFGRIAESAQRLSALVCSRMSRFGLQTPACPFKCLYLQCRR